MGCYDYLVIENKKPKTRNKKRKTKNEKPKTRIRKHE
jgi:hypothetical protein